MILHFGSLHQEIFRITNMLKHMDWDLMTTCDTYREDSFLPNMHKAGSSAEETRGADRDLSHTERQIQFKTTALASIKRTSEINRNVLP